eukprot:TRINITY_DN1204_c0_g1_i2.p1 TRINITY_DN1204_c0_g1~~TRINITY_DN1204_c0_g1_i2.p1  ORF type:complete len:342 (+),score=56.35 TRINITY_DN1204_c0_g1_i2:156-1181(+)
METQVNVSLCATRFHSSPLSRSLRRCQFARIRFSRQRVAASSNSDPPSFLQNSIDDAALERENATSREENSNAVSGLRRMKEPGLLDVAKSSEVKTLNSREEVKRSNLIARPVISKSSALRMGFVSQLFVNTSTWDVQVVEIRPNLLSGEMNRFFLGNICQVGDVVLVENEDILDNEPRMVGLDSLIGYDVITQDKNYLGKVRDYKFNICLGSVSYLEFDFLGISFIPASLVSTYLLCIEDVIEISSDTIVTCCNVKTHTQRLTKGLWDFSSINSSRWKEFTEKNSRIQKLYHGEYGRIDDETEIKPSSSFRKQGLDRHMEKRALSKETISKDEWELPLDY